MSAGSKHVQTGSVTNAETLSTDPVNLEIFSRLTMYKIKMSLKQNVQASFKLNCRTEEQGNIYQYP